MGTVASFNFDDFLPWKQFLLGRGSNLYSAMNDRASCIPDCNPSTLRDVTRMEMQVSGCRRAAKLTVV